MAMYQGRRAGDHQDVINNRDCEADGLANCRTAILLSGTSNTGDNSANNTTIGIAEIAPTFLVVNSNNAA